MHLSTRHTQRPARRLPVLLLALAALPAAAQTTRYRVELIDGGLGSSSAAYAQNQRGEVAGQLDRDFKSWPVLLRGARSVVLRERGASATERPGVVQALTEAGDAAGYAWVGAPLVRQPFVGQGLRYRLLPTPGGITGEATGLNSLGEVVGTLYPDFLPPRPVRHDGRRWVDLALPAGSQGGEARALNEAGVAAGWRLGSAGRQAIRWVGGLPQPQQGLGGESLAHALNAAGTMVGEAQPPRGYPWQHAVIFRDGQAIDLDRRSAGISIAYGINSAEQIVGGTMIQGVFHGFITTPTGGLQKLDDLLVPAQRGQWHVQVASGINDAGQIIGYGVPPGDSAPYRALRLVPVTKP